MRCAALTTALVVALALAGCAGGTSNEDSSNDFSGEKQQVASIVEDLQSAAEDSDEREICDLMTGELRDKVTSGSGAATCRAGLEKALKDTDQSDLTVKSVTIDGDEATAVVRAKLSDDRSREETIQLRKLGAAWRIAQLPSS
jgi:hypothetical protein